MSSLKVVIAFAGSVVLVSSSGAPAVAAQPSTPTDPDGIERPPLAGRFRVAGLELDETRAFFDQLQRTVLGHDVPAACALLHYPTRVGLSSGRTTFLATDGDCRKRFSRVFTPGVMRVLRAQRFEDVFANSKGVMIGNGEIWFSGICRDADCKQHTIEVVTITQPFEGRR